MVGHNHAGGVTPCDRLHFIISLLCHDIGYVRGICQGDGNGFSRSSISAPAENKPAERLLTDAAMTPRHVARSKLFVREAFQPRFVHFYTAEIGANIEHPRFPKGLLTTFLAWSARLI